MKTAAISRGRIGETIVRKRLEDLGMKFISNNYRSRYGEIDVIFKDGSYIVFIEVKARKENSMVRGMEAVGAAKREKIIKTACLYLNDSGEEGQPRFDVAEVVMGDDGTVKRILYVKNAFSAEGDHAFF